MIPGVLRKRCWGFVCGSSTKGEIPSATHGVGKQKSRICYQRLLRRLRKGLASISTSGGTPATVHRGSSCCKVSSIVLTISFSSHVAIVETSPWASMRAVLPARWMYSSAVCGMSKLMICWMPATSSPHAAMWVATRMRCEPLLNPSIAFVRSCCVLSEWMFVTG